MIIYRFKIICTVRHALRTVSIKALLLHALPEPLLLNTCLYTYIITSCNFTRATFALYSNQSQFIQYVCVHVIMYTFCTDITCTTEHINTWPIHV